MTEKQWRIIDKKFISYTGGYAYVISNGDCRFCVWERKEDVQKVCDKLNKLAEKNRNLQFLIIEMLDFIKENDGVTRQEMSDWWNKKVMSE